MSGNIILFLEPKGTVLEVVRAAKRRGFRVVALVSDPAMLETLPAPYDTARSCIDEITIVENWESESQILRLVDEINRSSKVVGVYYGVDACAEIGSRLRVRFGLPATDPESMELILNKCTLRWRLRQLGLSRLENTPSSIVNRWETWPLTKPVYFKPVHGAFSLNVVRCENLEDLRRAKTEWESGADNTPAYVRNYMRSTPEYHLEEEFKGELLSVEAISSNGKFHCLGLTSRILYSKDPTVEMGSCFPYPHPNADKIIELVKAAHEQLGFTDGPSHTEVIINEQGEIEIIDFNPRFIGADVLQSINFAYGIKIEEVLLDWTIGQPIKIELKQTAFSCIQYVLPARPLKFQSMEFSAAPEVKFSTSFLKPGQEASNLNRQIDYLGCYLTVMPSFEAATRRSRELRSSVRVNGNIVGAY
jgi:biotin carboxylase